MDEVHKHRINNNISSLVENTFYDPLVHSFERMDKAQIVPGNLLKRWQDRKQYGWSKKQLNLKLYEEIQRRGPEAFQLLLDCLQESGHHTLACLLEPTLQVVDTSEAETTNQEEEFYDDGGPHFVYLDNSWEGDECNADRKALQDLFVNNGYQATQKFPSEDVGSLLTLNFCSLDIANSGGNLREHDWVHKKFHYPIFDGKPKILISFRYNRKKGRSQNSVEHDSAATRKLYRDLLWVKIYLDNSAKKPEHISEEVKLVIQVLSAHHPEDIRDKLLRLQHEFEKHNLKPLNIQDSGFSKRFKFNKLSQ